MNAFVLLSIAVIAQRLPAKSTWDIVVLNLMFVTALVAGSVSLIGGWI